MRAAAEFEAVCALQAAGQYFPAHDRAMTALASGLCHDGLRHRAVLALAQAGATGSAERLYRSLGLAEIARRGGDEFALEIAALGARLMKDRALAGSADAAAAAQAAYCRLWQASGAAWHGVNAAAMALLARGARAAAAVIDTLGRIPDLGDYWSAATIAEAALLAGDEATAALWLAEAQIRAGSDLGSRSSTRRQLRWELRLLQHDAALLELLPIPDTVHFCGAIPRGADAAAPEPAARLRAMLHGRLAHVHAGFGSLAAGGDIVIAEALLDAGADLTVVLPFPEEAFIAASVAPAGEAWVRRFAACRERARVIVLEAHPHDDLDFVMASHRAMGLALLHARRIDGTARQIVVPPGAQAVSHSADEAMTWRAAGSGGERLPCPWQAAPPRPPAVRTRLLKAVLFGDMPGFGALHDRQLAAYYDGPLPAIGARAGAAEYRNAWGDAVKMVFASPEAAARCGHEIQRALTPEALVAWGLPPGLVPRIAIDFGPLQPVHDAVQGVAKFAGRVMTRAARIEPVTPPGLVYATEAFACELALLPGSGWTCDYAGLVPTAKGFGILPLYAVRALE